MSDSRGKCPDWFYETMDAAKLQRLQSEHMAIWDQFKLHAEARSAWHMALRMMVTEHRSFAEAAVFIGYRLPDPEANLDVDQLRGRLAKMTDVELRSFGKSAAYMCSP